MYIILTYHLQFNFYYLFINIYLKIENNKLILLLL